MLSSSEQYCEYVIKNIEQIKKNFQEKIITEKDDVLEILTKCEDLLYEKYKELEKYIDDANF